MGVEGRQLSNASFTSSSLELALLLPPGRVEGTRGSQCCCHLGGWGAHNAAATWVGGGD